MRITIIIANAKTWLRQQWASVRCPHIWRPALTSTGPAKHCVLCDQTVQLTEAEFYAKFGRMPIL